MINQRNQIHYIRIYQQKIINNGFDYEQVQASINKKNFSIKEEVNKTSSPKGVSYAIRLLRTWLYDDSDIFKAFDLDSMIDSLQQNCDRKIMRIQLNSLSQKITNKQ